MARLSDDSPSSGTLSSLARAMSASVGAGLASYGKTFAVLRGIELADDHKREDEDSLEESPLSWVERVIGVRRDRTKASRSAG